MERKFAEKPMKEVLYRESRIAKVLGDPAKYAIVNFLIKKKSANVSDIARAVHRHPATVSHHLAKLRSLEIVRYEVKADGICYWIKYPDELLAIIKALNHFVARTLKRVEDDI